MAERKKRRSKAEIEMAQQQEEKKKQMKAAAKKDSASLISKFVKTEFEKQIQKGKSALVNGYHTSSGKFEYKIVLHNWDQNISVIKVSESGWREGFWFYHFDSEKFIKFDKSIHKPEHGNHNVKWPTF